MAIRKLIKNLILNIVPNKVQLLIENKALLKINKNQEFSTVSYSQEGEDLILNRYFENITKGFYIDIGAHHPLRFSNTHFFYKKGWKGINIDPIPGSKEIFDKFRPNDINLEIGLSKTNEILEYYNFKEKALNTFSKDLANKYLDEKWPLINILKIETYPLLEILDRHLKIGFEIDFMSIDIEGLELEVIQSNNWFKFRPKILLIEILDFNLSNFLDNEIVIYLESVNYEIIAKTYNTVFFKRK